MSRWALETTRTLIANADVEAAIDRTLRRGPIDKPDDHKGTPETDCFCLEVPGAAVDVILDGLQEIAAGADRLQARRLRHLAIVWDEYRQVRSR